MQSKLLLILLLLPTITYAQENNIEGELGKNIVILDSTSRPPINPLSPAKAAFYSAILPGLGQAYNKKYWKVPLVYAALGTGIYFYIDSNKEYNRYRDAFKNRLAGFDNDEFWGTDSQGNALASPQISNAALIRAQRTLSRNREISLLITIGIYVLNIIDANVDAHLLQFNVDKNLALKPHFKFNKLDATTNLGLTLNFQF